MLIAQVGEEGKAERNVRPADHDNYGKVFVRWRGLRHGYWVRPDDIRFAGAARPESFIAVRVAHARAEDNGGELPALPRGSFSFDYDFGSNLKLIRRARSLSQGELGAQMGKHGLPLAQSTISYRESSPEAPGREFLRAAARALEVPPFVFLFPLAKLGEYAAAKRFLLNMSSAMAEA